MAVNCKYLINCILFVILFSEKNNRGLNVIFISRDIIISQRTHLIFRHQSLYLGNLIEVLTLQLFPYLQPIHRVYNCLTVSVATEFPSSDTALFLLTFVWPWLMFDLFNTSNRTRHKLIIRTDVFPLSSSEVFSFQRIQ